MGKLAKEQMKKVSAILMCGMCAAAFGQPARVQYTWEWSEVLAGTATPSTATPGVIDPTEGVRLTLRASFTPDVGHEVPFSIFGQSGWGSVRSWGFSYTILRGGPGTNGVFSHPVTARGFHNFNGDFGVQTPGYLFFDSVNEWFSPTQETLPNTANPVNDLISFTWTPSSYTPRTVSFVSEDPITAGSPNVLLIQYGTSPTGRPLIWYIGAQANHGPGTGGIPIVPGPGAAVVLTAWALMSGRRRSPQRSIIT